MPNSKKWLRPKLEYVFISTKLRKIKQFYLFLYNFFSFAWDGKYSPIPIPQKVFNNLYYFRKVKNFWERNLEAIPKKTETFVMFLYLRNGKYVSDFICWLFLFGFSRSGNYSNNSIFLFYRFFHEHAKSLSKTFYLREIGNVVWKWKTITNISFCTKR